MNELLKSPHQLFDVAGKVAVVTGATGAFGSVASRVLSGAACKLVLAGGNVDALTSLVDYVIKPFGVFTTPPDINQKELQGT